MQARLRSARPRGRLADSGQVLRVPQTSATLEHTTMAHRLMLPNKPHGLPWMWNIDTHVGDYATLANRPTDVELVKLIVMAMAFNGPNSTRHAPIAGPLCPRSRTGTFAGQQQPGETGGPAQASQRSNRRSTPPRPTAAAAVHVAVFAGHHVGQFAAVGGHAQAVGQCTCQLGAAAFVAQVTWPLHGRVVPLPRSWHQAGPAHRQRRVQQRAQSSTSSRCAPVSISGWCFGRLRHAPQAVQLGQQPRQRAAVAQHLEHAAGLPLPSGRARAPARPVRAPARRPRRRPPSAAAAPASRAPP
jgi:hypothetical protein